MYYIYGIFKCDYLQIIPFTKYWKTKSSNESKPEPKNRKIEVTNNGPGFLIKHRPPRPCWMSITTASAAVAWGNQKVPMSLHHHSKLSAPLWCRFLLWELPGYWVLNVPPNAGARTSFPCYSNSNWKGGLRGWGSGLPGAYQIILSILVGLRDWSD